jgi:predicted Rossmann fold flavoprotein
MVKINLLPEVEILELINANPSLTINKLLNQHFSKKLAQRLCDLWFQEYGNKSFVEISKQNQIKIAQHLHNWQFKPNGTEGYRTAEVTKGGVDTDEVSSKTFESHKVKGLYFIGEVLDVTAHLGGYNFQWAWSSGFASGQYV